MLSRHYHFLAKYRPPYSEGLEPHLAPQREFVDALIRKLGIDEVKFGGDVEFITEPNDSLLAEDTQRIAGELAALKKKVLAHVSTGPYAARIEEARCFTPEQLMMYEIHYLDQRTTFFLEPLFGADTDDYSFYDRQTERDKVVEVKIRPADSETFLRNLDTFNEVLYEKCRQYGLKPPAPPSLHLNMSFWRGGENLADPYHPEYTTTTAGILTGLQKAVAAGDFELNQGESKKYATGMLGVDRGVDDLRLTGDGETGRVELRMRKYLCEVSMPLIIEAIVKPGIAYGLMHAPKVQPIQRGLFERRGADFTRVTHALEGSIVKPTGMSGEYRLLPPEEYIVCRQFRQNGKDIAEELGLKYSYTIARHFEFQRMVDKQLGRKRNEVIPDDMIDDVGDDQLIELFKNIRLREEEGRIRIVWPTTKTFPNGKTYPLELPIDKLNDRIICDGIVPAFKGEAYDLTLIKDELVFRDTVQPEFFKKMQECLEAEDQRICEARIKYASSMRDS